MFDLAFVSVQSAEEKDSLLPLFPDFMNQVVAVGFIGDKPVWKLAPLLKVRGRLFESNRLPCSSSSTLGWRSDEAAGYEGRQESRRNCARDD